MAQFSTDFVSERPTLPPLHTLDLPIPGKSNMSLYDLDEFNDHQTSLRMPRRSFQPRHRQISVSSTTSSRTSASPPPCDFTSFRNPSSPSPPPTRSGRTTPKPKLRLVPSSLESADAVVLVPPPSTPFIPPASALVSPMESVQNGQALLLLGPALQHIRHPSRQLAKGARIHPYRIVRGGESSRRSSESSW